ncbi:MAG: hypothetical protein K0S81_3256 [Rhodospirillales bacterium]|jgi:hypothetical protein|nr:hypothetical protein [Rhodospirillales bacterium]
MERGSPILQTVSGQIYRRVLARRMTGTSFKMATRGETVIGPMLHLAAILAAVVGSVVVADLCGRESGFRDG